MEPIIIRESAESGTYIVTTGFHIMGEHLAKDEVIEVVKELLKE